MALILLIASTLSAPPDASIAEGAIAEAAADAAAAESAREQLVQSVEAALLADRDLAYHHSGYRTFWFGRAEWEAAETAYIAMQRSARLYPLIEAFDDALMTSTRADIAYSDFQRIQLENPGLRAGVEALEDTGIQWTMERLDRVIGSTQVGDLDPGLRVQDLLGPDRELAIRALATNPSARRRLEPWWQYQYDSPGVNAGRAYSELTAALRETPGGLSAWRKREALLSEEADDAAWIRYWHRRVRQTEMLGPRYYDYLAALQERPELGDANQQALRKAAAGRSWPPPGKPPKLDDPESDRSKDDSEVAEGPAARTVRPTSPRNPDRPARPVRGGVQHRRDIDDRKPARPTRPARPERNP